MTSDPFDEFEFRPLTEGLGFHKKPEKKSPGIATANAATSSAGLANLDLKQTLPEIEMPIGQRSPHSRRPVTETPKAPKSTSHESGTVDEILKTLNSKRKPDFTENRVSQAPAVASYRPASPDLSAFILDGMLVTAGSLACLIMLLMVTRVDLFAALTESSDNWTYAALGSLFAGVTWIYLVLTRMWMGFTPGEWVFDHRVGFPQAQGSADYSLRILARATLVVITGLLPLSLLSIVMGQDLIGKITGAPLLRKV